MQKIRYRLVYNRRNKLNAQGCALVQIEAKLNQRNIYMTTNVYLKPDSWDKKSSQVVDHPQAVELNAFLFEQLIFLQGIELSYWKRGIQPTLALIRETVHKGKKVDVNFIQFAKESIHSADKKESTKENLISTVRILEKFRPGIDFPDLTYSFLKEFEQYLKERGSGINTVAKHLRQLRTIINEAINEGYISQDSYPFRKYKIKQAKGGHEFLTPNELHKLEKLHIDNEKERHVLDAFLFCCYCGIRFSDFRMLKTENIVAVNRAKWLFIKMQKTDLEIKLPLDLLFDGKALELISKYGTVEKLVDIPENSSVNKSLVSIAEKAKIKKNITFHTSRHTCATILIYQGVPVTTVQKILGHTSLKTTQIYSEVLSNTIVKDLKKTKKTKKENA